MNKAKPMSAFSIYVISIRLGLGFLSSLYTFFDGSTAFMNVSAVKVWCAENLGCLPAS